MTLWPPKESISNLNMWLSKENSLPLPATCLHGLMPRSAPRLCFNPDTDNHVSTRRGWPQLPDSDRAGCQGTGVEPHRPSHSHEEDRGGLASWVISPMAPIAGASITAVKAPKAQYSRTCGGGRPGWRGADAAPPRVVTGRDTHPCPQTTQRCRQDSKRRAARCHATCATALGARTDRTPMSRGLQCCRGPLALPRGKESVVQGGQNESQRAAMLKIGSVVWRGSDSNLKHLDPDLANPKGQSQLNAAPSKVLG